MPNVPSLSLPTLDPKPFYAYVGAGDAAFAAVRTGVTTLPQQIKTLPASLKTASAQLPTQVRELPTQVKELPTQVKELQATFEKRYTELATRGEKVIAELRRTNNTPAKPKASAKKPATAKKAATVKKPAVKAEAATPATPTVTAPVQALVTETSVPTQTAAN